MDRQMICRLAASTLAAVLLAALPGCATAPAAPPDAVSAASVRLAPATRYLEAGQPDLLRFLPPPPAADSPEQTRDLAAVLASQAARTPAEVEGARRDQTVSVAHFADVLGPAFTAENLPRSFALAGKACRETSFAVAAAKRHWDRPRPFRASAEVRPVIGNVSEGSYPSGHAACGYLWAILLADLLPAQHDALFARGIAYGQSRVVGGVHYPTDLAAGRLAAAVVAAQMFASATFRADLEAARTEMAAAGLAPTP